MEITINFFEPPDRRNWFLLGSQNKKYNTMRVAQVALCLEYKVRPMSGIR